MAVQLATALTNLVDGASATLPNLIGAIILLIIGLVIGKIVGRIVKEALVRVKLDYYVSETARPKYSFADILSVISRWWIYLAFVTAALSMDILGIPTLTAWMAQVNALVISIVGATVILVVAYVVASYIKTQLLAIQTWEAALAGRVIFFLVMYAALGMSLPVLGFGAALVSNIMLILAGAIGLAIAIAAGLGARNMIGQVPRVVARRAPRPVRARRRR